MKKIFFILSLSLLSANAFSQIDREFWFAVPDITSGDGGGESKYGGASDASIKLCFASFDNQTTIHVTQPANASGFKGIDTVQTIAPNSFWVLDLTAYKSQLEVINGANHPYGLHVTSDNVISAYYANTSADGEIYSLKGKNALGADFIVPAQSDYPNGIYGGHNSIEIVASEDSTDVTINLSVLTLETTTANSTLKIRLNKGECYAVAAASNTGAGHLFNTHITSTKPIAVNTTDDSVTPGDLAGDQLVPTTQAGTKYIAIKGPGDVERVYIFPTANNTNIYIDGVIQTPTALNLGGKFMYDMALTTNGATYITANKPIIVYQLTSNPGGNEQGSAIVPKLDCTGSLETVYKPAYSTSCNVGILTKHANINNFTVNGNSFNLPGSVFKPVPGDTTWYYCFRNVSATVSNPTLRIKNSTGYFHMAAFDAGGSSNGLGWFSNFDVSPLQAVTNKSYYIAGDQLKLSIAGSSSFTNVQCTGPTGPNAVTYSSALNDTVTIPHLTTANTGMYVITASHVDGCITVPDTIMINVLKAENNTGIEVCKGGSETLKASGSAPYTWSPTGSTQQSITVSPTTSTIYTVTNNKQGQNMTVNGDFQAGNINFNSDYTYGGTGTTALTTPGTYTVWKNPQDVNSSYNRGYDHTTGDVTNGRLLIANLTGKDGDKVWTETQTVTTNTSYTLSAWFISAIKGTTPAQLKYSINGVKVGNPITPPNTDTGQLPAQWQQFSYVWNSGSSTSAVISIVTDGTVSSGSGVCIDDISFTPMFAVTDTFHVNVLASLTPIIKGDSHLCNGIASLDAGLTTNNSKFDTYLWNTGDTIQKITVTAAGVYSVKVTQSGCTGQANFTVAVSPEVTLSVNAQPETCANEPNFGIDYNLLTGELGSYEVLFDQKATQAGFTDMPKQAVTGTQFVILLPANVRPNIYNAVLKVYEKNCGDSTLYPIDFKVKYDTTVMTQRWNDVIGVKNSAYNGGYTFTGFQWYKNGAALSGQTSSNLYVSAFLNVSDRYSVMLTRNDGVILPTCDFAPTLLTSADIVPTFVSPSQVISLKTICTSGIVSYTDITGRVESRQPVGADNTSTQVPAQKGMYILQIATEDENKQYKIIVK